MLKTLERWRKGYLKILVTGFASERFFNLCCANQVDIWEIRPCESGFICYITVSAFRKIRPWVKKAKVRLKILGRFGLPFFLYWNRKRKGLFGGFVVFFLLLYGLSLFVWNISFEGNYYYSRDTLLSYLESEGIRYGMRKNSVSCEELEEGIRSAFPEITWVSARVSGTRLLVKIKENEVLSEIPQKEEWPCELIAAKNGVITSLIVRQGKAVVKEGDAVEKGQLLVSSELSITDDSGTVIRRAFVHADADIYAETRYSYKKEFSMFHEVSVATGKKRYGFLLKIGPYQGRFLMPDFQGNSWNYVSESHQLHFLEDFYLPVFWESIVGESFVSYERPYTEEELEEVSKQLESKYLKNLMEKGVHIIENNVKIQENAKVCIIEGTVTANEAIAQPRRIEESEQLEETKGGRRN